MNLDVEPMLIVHLTVSWSFGAMLIALNVCLANIPELAPDVELNNADSATLCDTLSVFWNVV